MKSDISKLIINEIKIEVFKAGIKKNKLDLLLITLPENSSISGVFTKSFSSSAAVNFCKENLKSRYKNVRAILVNSGNSNAFTGSNGVKCVQTLLLIIVS